MSIASDLSRLQTAKASLKASIGNKGVTVPDEAKMDSYSGYIDQISSGGATPTKGFLPTAWDEDGYVTEGTLYGMTEVPQYFFYNNLSSRGFSTRMTNIDLPSGITSIGTYAFYNCTSLALTSLPSGITSIGTYAFCGCTPLALTSLPSGITSIGTSAFYGCTSLALTSLPSGITSIGTYAFRGCTSLAKIWIPSSCISIFASSYSKSPFYNCSSSLTLYCEAEAKPDGWEAYWNYYSSSGTLTVVWGFSKEEFEAL